MHQLFLIVTLCLGIAYLMQRDTCRQSDRMSFYSNWSALYHEILRNPKYEDLTADEIRDLGDLICYGLYSPLTRKQKIRRSVLPVLLTLFAIAAYVTR